MIGPYRTASVPEPPLPDEADAYEAALRRRLARSRWSGGLLAAVLGLGVFAFARRTPPRTPPNVAALRTAERLVAARATISAARAFALREQATFASTVGAALDADLAATTPARPCEVRLADGEAKLPLLIVPKGDRELPSPSVAAFLADVTRAEAHLRLGREAEAVTYANALEATMASPLARLHHDVVVVTTSMKHPVRTTATSFEPGELTGRAYVYDFGLHRVTCVGGVRAASSSTITYSYAPTSPSAAMDEGPRLVAFLEDDLDRRVRRAIADGALLRID